MNKFLLLTIIGCLQFYFGNSQNAYKIDVTIKAFANQQIYLGYYFGKTFPIKDSVKLDAAGKGSFKGKEKLVGGIYLLGYPSKREYVEMLVDKNQTFAISVDSPMQKKGIRLTNSPEGSEFQAYQNFMEANGKALQALDKLNTANTTTSKTITQKKKAINDAVNKYRETIIAKGTKNLLPAILNLLKIPIVPDVTKMPNGKYDSTFAWYYYKSNYWNGVNFADERLLRTPIYESKFDDYFKTIIYPQPDSIINEANKILVASIANTETFKYNTTKLIQRYINPEYMGQDAVYVHLFEKYIAPGTANWFDEKQKKFLFDRGYSLISNKIGDPAPALDLVDTLGNPISLYNIKSNYTVICFWDATCGHCKEVVPSVDSIYKAKWKQQGVTLLGVMTDGGLQNWKTYITEHQFTNWIHAYQTDENRKKDNADGKPNFRQLYDIVSTPKLYLLDKDKHIIAKQLTYQQLDDLLNKKLENK